jgi:hypothetical protein
LLAPYKSEYPPRKRKFQIPYLGSVRSRLLHLLQKTVVHFSLIRVFATSFL